MTSTHSAPVSPLGCRLHDWNIGAREPVSVSMDARQGSRGLVLDLDDTLYPREHFVQSGLMAVARHVQDTYGVPAMQAFATMAEARRRGDSGREFQAVCAAHDLSGSCSGDLIASLVEVFRRHRPLLRLPRETASVLGSLRASGWRLVVLTNGLPSVQRGKVQSLGLRSLVDEVIYAEEHAPGGKPAAAAFRAALSQLSLPARRCVCVGDDPVSDIAGARAMGLATIWMSGGDAIADPRADATIVTIAQLPAALAQVRQRVNSDAA